MTLVIKFVRIIKYKYVSRLKINNLSKFDIINDPTLYVQKQEFKDGHVK